MPELLWEIGCEELPATFVAPSMAQLEQQFRDKFTAAGLWNAAEPNATVRVYGTPRRLIVHATGLAVRQGDETSIVKGPAERVAFDDEGKPTRAALGFAQKNGLAPEALTVVDGYVQASVTRVGRDAIEIAAELLPKIARELTFPKAMRWGASKLRFARPIRWILALLDDQIIPFHIEHVGTGRKTRGHRFLAPDEIEIADVDAYFAKIRDIFVLIEPSERRSMILSQTQALAHEAGGTAEIDPDLLEENVHLTEYPTSVLGSFDSAYLDLPRPILVTAMRKHQRYFPVVGPDGHLLPRFIAVRNGGDQYLDTVRAGFENVLSARFADAKFFFDLDSQTPLTDKIDATKKIVFQEKLGTVYEKSQRLTPILQYSGLLDHLTHDQQRDLLRAAVLCKADLASEMVKELPALQGTVGKYYALRDGETSDVAAVIAEHYMPKGAGEPLPSSALGRRLAIADRIDTLTGYVGIGIVPTGTSDPYALRRAAAGLVALLATDAALPAIRPLFDIAWNSYGSTGLSLTEDKEAAYKNVRTLVTQRLDAALEEKGVRYDIRDAVLSVPIETVFVAESRAISLGQHIGSESTINALAAVTRIGNILRFAAKEGIAIADTQPDPSVFEHNEEGQLWAAWRDAEPNYQTAMSERNWPEALGILGSLRDHADAFFNAVMVMDPDTQKRDNRLTLLARLRDAFQQFADFEKIAG